MALKSLTSRAILGEFARAVESAEDHGYVTPLTEYFPDSNMFTEEHRWVGAAPGFVEWTGTRRVKELTDYLIKVQNKPYEATLSVFKDEVKYDKTQQVQNRINSHARASMEHWEELLVPLIQNGATGLAYDGQNFFDTDHQEGESGVQSNIVTADISDMPIDPNYKGTPTAPSALQLAHAITLGIQRFYTFKNDRGKPLNQNAKQFLVMVPVPYMNAAMQAVKIQFLAHGEQNPLNATEFTIKPVVEPRLTWTDRFAIFRTDGMGGAKPFIRQQMGEPEYTMLGEDSDLYHRERRMEYGAFVQRGVGYGLWQHAVQVIFQA